MSIYKMQLDPAVTEKRSSHPPPPDTLEQHETPDKAPVALTPYGLRKSLPETIKKTAFF